MREGATSAWFPRTRALILAVGVTAGRTAFRRTAPFYFAVAIVAGLAFGGNGMNAADLTALMRRSLGLRLSLWGLWLAGSLPAAHAILTEPRLFFLRSLPVARWRVLAVHALLLLVAELPWVALHARGDGALSGLAAALAACGLHAFLVARLRPGRALPVVILLALALLWPLSAPWLLAVGAGLLGLALPVAYARAPERVAGAGPTLISARLGAVLALPLAYLTLLWRGQRPLLLRCALLCLLSAAIAALAIRNNQIATLDGQNTLSLGVLQVPLLLSLVSLTGPLLRVERELDWLLATCGIEGRRRVQATWLALLAVALVFSLIHGGVLVAWLAPSGSAGLRLLLPLLGLAPVVAAGAQAAVRLTAQGTPKDSDRLLFLLLGVIPLCILFAWLFHEALLLPWAMAALVGSEGAARRILPRGRFERLRHERQRRRGDDL